MSITGGTPSGGAPAPCSSSRPTSAPSPTGSGSTRGASTPPGCSRGGRPTGCCPRPSATRTSCTWRQTWPRSCTAATPSSPPGGTTACLARRQRQPSRPTPSPSPSPSRRGGCWAAPPSTTSGQSASLPPPSRCGSSPPTRRAKRGGRWRHACGASGCRLPSGARWQPPTSLCPLRTLWGTCAESPWGCSGGTFRASGPTW
mmetsp:Transcript_33757/g.86488  ORF Transcript_33757/g.86488 Transcript_33757/m.86488 type:complete len:201 (+) Transcript_33757:389-991(+)